jgi:hypothetical protein
MSPHALKPTSPRQTLSFKMTGHHALVPTLRVGTHFLDALRLFDSHPGGPPRVAALRDLHPPRQVEIRS